MESISDRMRACCRVVTVNICPDNGNSAEVDVVVVCDKPLGFD